MRKGEDLVTTGKIDILEKQADVGKPLKYNYGIAVWLRNISRNV